MKKFFRGLRILYEDSLFPLLLCLAIWFAAIFIGVCIANIILAI